MVLAIKRKMCPGIYKVLKQAWKKNVKCEWWLDLFSLIPAEKINQDLDFYDSSE